MADDSSQPTRPVDGSAATADVPDAGVLVIDKPLGVSSARIVARVKGIARSAGAAKRYKVGHAGTLDPAATGVLVLLLGKATKQCERMMGLPKTYRTTVRLGATTPTDDAEGEPTPWPDAMPPTLQDIHGVLTRFTGTFEQTPPQFSAVKVGGRRAYAAARSGETVEIEPKTVRCDRLELVRYDWPDLVLEMDTGRGFYVRSLARDLGTVLNVGGYLTALRRTAAGPFSVDNAVDIETLDRDGISAHLFHEVPA
ncbi:MAG: tRNA pseudouridine(55) synthase TruB [Planctomycetota bacterium]